MEASFSFSLGTIKYLIPSFTPAATAPKTPRTGRTPPESSSSPITIVRTSLNTLTPLCILLIKTESAMGRSKLLPSFFKSAGLKLINILACGNSNSELRIATFILSFASFTALPGKPTISMTGKPILKSASTLMIFPS